MRCFNPRTPCGVRPTQVQPLPPGGWFQSTHSLRSATVQVSVSFSFYFVSIHALLAECDSENAADSDPGSGFNPRTPCGVRLTRFRHPTRTRKFQSTHSLRSATRRGLRGRRGLRVSIHALLAECDCLLLPWLLLVRVSIHALLAECDSWCRPQYSVFIGFQSTHSLRSATLRENKKPVRKNVSIHALLAECDHSLKNERCESRSFNPRTPCGVRQVHEKVERRQEAVSIHALLAECDR